MLFRNLNYMLINFELLFNIMDLISYFEILDIYGYEWVIQRHLGIIVFSLPAVSQFLTV